MHFFRKFLFLMVLTVIALLFTSQVFAEKILFSDDFEEYQIGSTPSAWFQQRNFQWGNFNAVCLYNTQPAEWKIVNVNGSNRVKIQINGNPCQMEISPIGLKIPDTSNYQYDLDITFVDNVVKDRNVVFRYLNGSQWYGLKLIHPTYIEFVKTDNGGNNPFVNPTYSKSFEPNQTYHFTIKTIDNKVQLFINDEFVYEAIDQEPILREGTIALQASLGSHGETVTYFDNIVVTDLSKPKVNLLNIPFFSQIDPQWANDTYDSADKWAKPGFQGIKDYGCAITSAAMILNYQGFNTTPSGDAPTTPQTLNNYLKSINGGYSKNGFLIWPALTSYAKEAADKGDISPNAKLFQFSYGAYSKDALIEDLTASKAGILRIVTNPHDTTKTDDDDTHFVVYKGWDEDKNIYLADPLTLTDDNPKLEEAYNGKQYSKIGYFHDYIDPSYLWMYLNDPQGKMVIEKGDKALGPKEGINRNDFTNSQFSLEKISAGDTDNSDPASWQYLIPNPEKGEYKLTLSTPTEQITPLEIFAFNNQAKEKVILPQLIVGPDNQRVITLSFDPSGNVIANITTESNFKTLKATVAYVFNQHKLPKNHLNLYLRMIESSEHMSHKFDWLAKGTLRGLDQQCNVLKRKQILSASEYSLIHDEITRVLEKYQRIKHK